MPTYPIDLLPPRDWQIFEDFCRDLMRAEWGDSAQLHGRQGQGQEGVDVYAMSDSGYVAFQCKSKGQRSDARLKPSEINEDVKKARKFEPPLSKLIFATTAQRDTKAQAAAREHTDESFTVEVKFWDDLLELLPDHPQVWKRWRRRLSLGTAEPQVSTSKLPAASPEKLIGRDAELERLDEAWTDPKIHALSLIAIGGAGKTSLVDHWIQRMVRADWRGAEAVFLWSFYSQGAGEDRQASGDAFIDEALRFFGDPDPTEGSPRQRGVRLATLVRERHSLLVLDGLEPIQHPPTHGRPGQIKDPGVSALVRELASSQPGLLVITSRQPVADVKGRTETSAPVMDLERLSTEAGRDLLSHLGVEGKDEELEEVTEEVHGHALTLTLLGTFLEAAHDGDIRAWHDSPLLKQAEMIGDTHATRVMAAYAEWFGEGPERQILFVLGLFDRPADADAVVALRKPPAIDGLTDQLVELSTSQWNISLDRLRKARLLLDADSSSDGELDAHPLVREHFGRVLECENREAYQEGHNRLYEYYAEAALEFPDTLSEMEPLYRAIGHGCRAGGHQKVYDEVYWQRVLRGDEDYKVKKLGAFGSYLMAVASFFEQRWVRPAAELQGSKQAWLFNAAGFCLRALGRLEEAKQATEAGLELAVAEKDWKNAAIYAINVSELDLILGRTRCSLQRARYGVELADKSGIVLWRMASRATFGDACHAAGNFAEAEQKFRAAESLQVEYRPLYPNLYSQRGFRFCRLLLGQATPLDGSTLEWPTPKAISKKSQRLCEIVVERARIGLEVALRNQWLLEIGLDHLSLGRAKLGLALATDGDLDEAKTELDQAVQGLRKAGQEQYLPNGLLARATLHRFHENEPAAETDLAEALEIAERGSMRLHECDAHLEWGRLRYSVEDREGARAHLEVARKIVEETGYGRREREVRELSEALGAVDE